MTEFMFDPLEGKLLLGQPAISLHLEAGGDAIPLAEALTLPEFPYRTGDYPRQHVPWDDTATEDYGRFLLGILQAHEPDATLRTQHIDRMAILALGPSERQCTRSRSLLALKEAIGSPIRYNRGHYAHWELADFYRYAEDIHASVVKREGRPRRLRRADVAAAFQEDKGPSMGLVYQQGGGLANLNEHLGYPNVHDWDEDDAIAWGVRVFRANEGNVEHLSSAITYLSKLDYGPSDVYITKQFSSIPDFRAAVEKKFAEEEASRQQRLEACRTLIETGSLKAPFLNLNDDELLSVGARWQIIEYIESRHRVSYSKVREVLMHIKNPYTFMASVARYGTAEVTTGLVENVASMLGLYDDLVMAPDQHLKLPEKYNKQRTAPRRFPGRSSAPGRVAFGFDPLEGVLLVGEHAIALHLEAGGESIPLAEALRMADFPYQAKDYPRQPQSWTRQAVIDYGKWLLARVQEVDPQGPVRTEYLRRMARLALGAPLTVVEGHFNRSRRAFREAIGSPMQDSRGKYTHWGERRYQAYAVKLHEKIAKTEGTPRKLKADDIRAAFRADEGPGMGEILRKGGGIAKLNEFLGYPDVDRWKREDYIAWGTRFYRANDGWPCGVETALVFISKHKRGPSDAAVYTNIGSLPAFAEEIEQRVQTEDKAREQRLGSYRQGIARGDLQPQLLEDPEDALLAAGGRRRLFEHFARSAEDHRQFTQLDNADLEAFARALAQHFSRRISIGTLKAIARKEGLYDDLWPPSYEGLRLDAYPDWRPRAKSSPRQQGSGSTSPP